MAARPTPKPGWRILDGRASNADPEPVDVGACFTSVVMKNRTGVLVLDTEGRVRFANPAAEQSLGRDHQALIGSHFGLPALGERAEIQIRRPSGEIGVAEVTSSATEWNGEPAHLVMLYDITDRKAVENEVRHMANHDSLTGLMNRVAFQARLKDALERAGDNGTRLAVLFMDLDRFKAVNDTLGHQVGDALLRALARRLPRKVRSADTVARLGGDEFVVLLEAVGEADTAIDIAHKLLEATVRPMRVGDRRISVGASIGIAVFPDHGTDVETLMRHADTAMYEAKRLPAEHVYVFHPGDDVEVAQQLDLEAALAKALVREEYELYFQPQFDVHDRRLIGMEALLRWKSAHHGLVPPNRFIPTLEATGQILEVGRWVLRQACLHINEWRQLGLEVVPVAINVSPLQLSDARFADRTLATIEDYGLAPEDFIVEITESAVIPNLEHAELVLESLAKAGIRLHLDDFGTGFSSLTVLKSLPFDTLKIDRSFTADVVNDARSGALAESIIQMAHDLGMGCIAEGVEDEAQLAFLSVRGCDRVQGYLTGRPAPAHHVVELLAASALETVG